MSEQVSHVPDPADHEVGAILSEIEQSIETDRKESIAASKAQLVVYFALSAFLGLLVAFWICKLVIVKMLSAFAPPPPG